MRRLSFKLLPTSLSLAEYTLAVCRPLSSFLCSGSADPWGVFSVCFACHFLLVALLGFLPIRAEGITPSPSPTTSLSFAVLDLCTRPSPSLLICPLSSFPEMEPLLVTCSTFTAISSFPPCSQKTCKDLFSLPAFLPLPASIFTDVALKWLCHRPEKGKTAFSMSGSQQYKHGSVGVKQHGE